MLNLNLANTSFLRLPFTFSRARELREDARYFYFTIRGIQILLLLFSKVTICLKRFVILLICSIYLQAIKKWDSKYDKIKPNKTKDEQCFINKPSIAFTNLYGAPNANLLLTRAFFHLFYYCFVGLNGNRSVVSFTSFRSSSLLKLSFGYYFKRIVLAT